MNQAIIMATTNSIEGMKIEKYFDLISTNVVLGTNVFSDIGASFSDFFGGTSAIYQNKLERIYKVALDKLREKAKNINANGVIGVNIDFDEVSGGGKSMFMISVSGTAVRLSSIENQDQKDESRKMIATPSEVDNAVSGLKIIIKAKNGLKLLDDEWEFLLTNPIEEILPVLLEQYLLEFKDYSYAIHDYQERLRKYFSTLLKQSDENLVSKILYDKYEANPTVITTLIKESETFDPKLTLQLLESNKKALAISSTDAHKRYYTIEDLDGMNSIVEFFNKLPKTGKIEMVKGMLGSKERYICEAEHSNPSDEEFCGNCGKNIVGLTKEDIAMIKHLELKIEGLKALLN